MSAPKRLKIRQQLNAPISFELDDIVPIFQRWIQEDTIPGLLIDVANYKHVPNGPGILLIGDEGDYSLEMIDGQLFFVYDRKRQTGNNISESIRILLATAQAALQAIEDESSLDLSIAEGATEITLLDRLQYPNEQAVFDAISNSVAHEVSKAYDWANPKFHQQSMDQRRPLTLQIQAEREAVPA